MRSGYICLWLLAFCLGTGAAAAQDLSLQPPTGASEGDVGLLNFSLPGFGAGTDLGSDFNNASSARSFLSEFYINASVPMVSGPGPVKIDIARNLPGRLYFGSGRYVAFAEYQSATAPSRGNELWIEKGADWSQYGIVPEGAQLQLIAFAAAEGEAELYEIIRTGSTSASVTSKLYHFYSGYNAMGLSEEIAGRHILLFVLNHQPSNAIILDVVRPEPVQMQAMPQAAGLVFPATGQLPLYGGQTPPPGGQAMSGLPGTGFYAPPSGLNAGQGDTPVTIQTQMRGYDVYVDGVLIGKDGAGSDLLDGIFKFSVVGGQTHVIRIFDGVNNYEKHISFEKGVPKVINVPPAATVHSAGGLL